MLKFVVLVSWLKLDLKTHLVYEIKNDVRQIASYKLVGLDAVGVCDTA